ncbi:MAG: diacylglycerol kinase family protein [Casimicrobiaceae bacterium]
MADAPFFIVLNAGAGSAAGATTHRAIGDALAAGGRAHEFMHVEDPAQLREVAARAVAKARESGGVVVAAGGDGTLNAVAQATLGSGCPFGVIPRGTFNYFGRTHGIATDPGDAARALVSAVVHPVQVGLVNDRVFLVNASLGLYPQSLDDREEQTTLHGRRPWVAAWAALLTILRGYRPMRIRLDYGGVTQETRVLTLFVGNNRLQLEQVGLEKAGLVDAAQLVAVVVRPLPSLSLLWLLAKGAMRDLGGARGVQHYGVSSLKVTPSNPRVRRIRIATDGETVWMDTPIEFRIAPQPLLLLKPVDAVPETAAS